MRTIRRRSSSSSTKTTGQLVVVTLKSLQGTSTTKAGMTLGVYVQHAYEREKREALDLWANRLHGIISGAGEVVAIHATK
jgi:hypothetical protein